MRIVATAVACALLLGGCATITRGTTEAWSVQTVPAGADVKLSSGEQCKSPCTLTKKRKDPFQVTISKDGYESVSTQIIGTVKGAGAAGMAGNVLIGGIIGIGVDAADGATLSLTPNPLIVTLALAGSGQTSVINTPPPPPPEKETEGDGRAERLASHSESARFALSKMQCTTAFHFVSLADDVETYQAQCNDGRTQKMQCGDNSCQPVK